MNGVIPMNKPLRALGVGAAAVSLVLLAGCSGGGSARTGASASALTADAQTALAVVQTSSAPVDTFEAPGPAVDGRALAGKTVYFIPASLQVPVLATIGTYLGSALKELGATMQTCDGKVNPSDIASCVAQATDAGAAAVVTAGITPDFAPSSFASLTAAGIPWVQGLTVPAGEGDPRQIAYVSDDGVMLQRISTNWVIADSNAAADVLVVKLTDNPAVEMYADQGILATYQDGCPDCTVQVIEINSGQRDRLQSLVSAALVANPKIGYVQAQFDQFVSGITQGIQSAGRDDVKIASVDATLSTLQNLASGGPARSVVGYNRQAMGWYMADAVVRMTAGQPSVQNLEMPFRRAFNESNIAGLELTPAAEADGSWFGDADYQDKFLALWGAR
jgi:ribose transport system substrate-binding protein